MSSQVGEARLKPKRILVIDDEASILTLVDMAFTFVNGWEALTTMSGKAGIELAAREQPDAILLDMMMPEMSGLTVLERLRNNPATSRIPVILFTAKTETGTLVDYRTLNTAGIIGKPFDPVSLADHISGILGWS